MSKEGDASPSTAYAHSPAQQLHDEPHAEDKAGRDSRHSDAGHEHQHVGVRK